MKNDIKELCKTNHSSDCNPSMQVFQDNLAKLLKTKRETGHISIEGINEILGFRIPKSTFLNYQKNGPPKETIRFLFLLHKLKIPLNLIFTQPREEIKEHNKQEIAEQVIWGQELYKLNDALFSFPSTSRLRPLKAILHLLQSINTDLTLWEEANDETERKFTQD